MSQEAGARVGADEPVAQLARMAQELLQHNAELHRMLLEARTERDQARMQRRMLELERDTAERAAAAAQRDVARLRQQIESGA